MTNRVDVLRAVQAARQARERVPMVLRRLARYYEVTDLQLALALDVSRQTVNSWVNGRTRIPDEIEAGLAAFFGVPREVLYLSPDDALRWVLDHPQVPFPNGEQGVARNTWNPVAAA